MAAARPRIDLQALFRLTELADYIIPFTIRAVCELGVADHLADGPRPVAELAAATGAHAGALQRALRALACKGVFAEIAPGCYGLTPSAELLRSDHPLSLRAAYPLLPGDIGAWAHFDHSLRTGEPAFDQAHGKNYWDYLAEHPEERARFDGAQEATTRLDLRMVLRFYDWGSLGTLVDVGGGNGAFLAGLLARHPAMRGVLLDLPHAVAGAAAVLGAAGVADRCEVVAGSFFDRVPDGADAYLLKRTLYGWDDERAVVLLANTRAAMRPDSRLLVIEPVVGVGEAAGLSARYDLRMLALGGSAVRTREQLAGLFAQASLKLTNVIPSPMFPIVEARPD